MIQITKREAARIREKLPNAHIKRTVNKYYVEDVASVRNELRKLNRERGAVRFVC